jgi:hypothetical protein
VRILAADWSGKLKRAEEFLWLAEARDGKLCELSNGLTREELVRQLIALAEEDPHVVVGLDFAFSFPAWWCAEQSWSSGPEVWAAMAELGESEVPRGADAGTSGPPPGQELLTIVRQEHCLRSASWPGWD